MTCLEQSFMNVVKSSIHEISKSLKRIEDKQNLLVCYSDINGNEHIEVFRHMKHDEFDYYINSDEVTKEQYEVLKEHILKEG